MHRGGVAFAVEKDFGEISAGEQDERFVETAIKSRDGGGDEATEAGALQGNPGGVDEW